MPCALALAQQGYPNLTNVVQTRPQAIPTSATTVISQDAYICYGDFQATGQTLTIADRQATPVNWINNSFGASASLTTIIFTFPNINGQPTCRWFPNGITIQASTSGITGYLIIACPTRCSLQWGF